MHVLHVIICHAACMMIVCNLIYDIVLHIHYMSLHHGFLLIYVTFCALNSSNTGTPKAFLAVIQIDHQPGPGLPRPA
jgi:hypothetical protein